MEGKVAVLGDADFVMPFSALGLDTYPAAEPQQVIESARKIIGDRYTLVVVAENIAPVAEDVFAARQTEPVPCVVVVPFTTEPTGFATESLNRVLKIATGIDIMRQ